MTYEVRVWWDRPGEVREGDEDLGDGWVRCHQSMTLPDAAAVAEYLKGHPDAQSAQVWQVDLSGHADQGHLAERTILGWLISPIT